MLDKDLYEDKTKSKKEIIAHPESMKAIREFRDMYILRRNAAKALEISNVSLWMLCNGFTRVQSSVARKIEVITGGKINYDILMLRKK